jgi:galactoside O-acetyltransferase
MRKGRIVMASHVLYANEYYEWLEMFFSLFPGGIGGRVRRVFYKRHLKSLGVAGRFGIRGRIQCPQAVTLGDNVGLNDYYWIAANTDLNGYIHIGNNVLIGPYCIMHTGNHKYLRIDMTIKAQGHSFSPIYIEDDVWVAARCTILAGVTLKRGSVIAAGTVVTKSTDEFSVWAGCPARQIGKRDIDSHFAQIT